MEKKKDINSFKKKNRKKLLQKQIAFLFYAYGSQAIDKLIYYGSRQFTINDFNKINSIRHDRNIDPLEFWDMFDSELDYIGDELTEPEEDKDISKVLVP